MEVRTIKVGGKDLAREGMNYWETPMVQALLGTLNVAFVSALFVIVVGVVMYNFLYKDVDRNKKKE